MSEMIDTDPRFAGLVNLAQPRLGTEVVAVNDEFFGACERLLKSEPPVFIANKFDDHGKWMDGWETRRRREPGYDQCVIRLGSRGLVRGFDVDTTHFSGNHAPEVSIDGCCDPARLPTPDAWTEILPRTPLGPDSHHYLAATLETACTHLRLNMYPDGGIARLRVYGEVQLDWAALGAGPIDLLAIEHGGRALVCSDEHFGSMHNLNAPGRGVNMGDGWETARRRGPGYDWVVMALGAPSEIERVVIDTAHFKGNYPDRVSLQATRIDDPDLTRIARDSESWPLLLEESRTRAHHQHEFGDALAALGPVSHVRLNMFPDGGISRVRLFGRPA